MPGTDLPATTAVRAETEGSVIWLVLNRPDRLNAMTATMCREVAAVLDAVAAGPWRCLVIRGQGRAFCAGADLAGIHDEVDVGDPGSVRRFLDEGWQAVVSRLRQLPVPSVAAVHGPAYGGGCNLALATDFVLAAESAVFCQSYIDRGLSPDLGGSWILPRLAGLHAARRMLLLGEPVNASMALRYGLASEVVTEADLVPRARATALALAAKDPTAMRVTRALIDRNLGTDLSTALADESAGIAATIGRPAFRAASSEYRRPAHTDRTPEGGSVPTPPCD